MRPASLRKLAWWAVAAAGTIVISTAVRRSGVSDAEAETFRAVNGLPGGLYAVVGLVGQVGNFLAIPVATGVALALRRRRLALDLATAGMLAWLLGKVVKRFIERGRPADYLVDVTIRGAPQAGLGYVSGHVAVIAALAMISAPYLPRRFRWTPWALLAVVSFSRMYVGAHLPLDVVGGALVGWSAGLFVRLMRPAAAEAWTSNPVLAAPAGAVLYLLLFTLVGDWRRTAEVLAAPRWSWIGVAVAAALLLTMLRPGARSSDAYSFGGAGLHPKKALWVLIHVAAFLTTAAAAWASGVIRLGAPAASSVLAVIAATVTLLGLPASDRSRPRPRARERAGVGALVNRARGVEPSSIALVLRWIAVSAFSFVALLASVAAFHPIVALLVILAVYLLATALGAAVPLVGGLGLLDVALIAGLAAVGLDASAAVAAVLLYRLVTFWLPSLGQLPPLVMTPLGRAPQLKS